MLLDREDYCEDENLSKIHIVLIETSHPGNIGAVARAMKNMGLSKLRLVRPKSFPSAQASARASSACDVLDNAEVFESLDEAIADCKIVVGASGRLRRVSWPMLDVRETAKKTIEITSTQGGSTAIVFGRENSGLTNAEMDKCNYLGYIPSNPAYSSLNIAAAVQVFAYECLMQLDQSINHVAKVKPEINTAVSIDEEGYKYTVASSNQLEGFYDHLFQALQDIEFLDPNKNALFMRRMRRLFNRAQLDVKEIDILRGILTATQRQSKKLKQCN